MLTNEFPDLKVIVHAVDPVRNRAQRELGSSDSTTTNPFNSRYFTWDTDFQNQFNNTENLSIRSFLSGEQVIDDINADGDGPLSIVFEGANEIIRRVHAVGQVRSGGQNNFSDDLELQVSRIGNNFNGASAIFNLMLSDDQ